jgi:exosortase H (IPTLxxWG-CTERM-specific)
VLRFSFIFGVLLVLFYSLTAGATYDNILAAYLNYSARLSSLILNGFGVPSFVSGLTIESTQFAFTVQRGCDALEPSWFFLTAVLAFPARFMRKVLGVLAGVTLLNLLNLIRIASLFLVGSYYPSAFNTIHVELWPAAFIILSILLWIGWVAWTRQDDVAA